MKWLLIGPDRPDTFADNLRHTLQASGEETRVVSARSLGRLADKLGSVWCEYRARSSAAYIPSVEVAALRIAREWKPDVFLAPTHQMSEAVLSDMRRAGVRHRVVWWADPPANLKRWGVLSPEWDLLLFKDRAAVEKHRSVGLNAHLMHEAMNPAWHRPVAERVNEELVVAGNWYGFRQYLVRELTRRGVKVGIYGPPPPRWATEAVAKGHTGRYVTRLEKSQVFGEGLGCLNSTQVVEGNSLNCRAFEIAGAGGYQIIEHRPVIEECFAPGVEVAVFRSVDEIVEHLDRARRAPEDVRRIRQAGARRALQEHTYQHRIDAMKELMLR